MKRSIYSLLFSAFVVPLSAQNTEPLFKPTKVSYYYEPIGGWKLETVRKFTYDTKGNAMLILTESDNGTPVRKDSNIFSTTSQILEIHRFYWAASENKHLPDEKIITSYDAQGRIIGSLSYLWSGLWHLTTGTERLISYNTTTDTEIDITRLYDEETETWYDFAKTLTKFNELGQKDTVTVYTTDPQRNFVLFSRQSFSGWYNYEKNIEKGQTNERYINGTWELDFSSSTEKVADLWVKTEVRMAGSLAGTYRIFFEEDGNYREVMKQNNPGWLSLSIFSRTGNIEKIIQNGFEGDVLKKIETDEKEIDDQGNLIRTTERIQGQDQQTTSFSEIVTMIQYDQRQLPLEEISKVTSDESRSNYALFEKVVYADYVDVRLTTDLQESRQQLGNVQVRVFPNPSLGKFRLSEDAHVTKMAVYSNEGQLLRNIGVQGNEIDLTELPTGIYLLQLDSESGVSRQKVVISAQ